jgi:purine-nucleoside phosphorylase
LRTDWNVGTPVVIRDHINLTAHSPLTGDNAPAPLAGRFVDLTDAYNESLRALVRAVEPGINEAVYLGLHGPHFETPAEIRMAATWGAEMVGMSTVLETIAARHLGMNVLALSLATFKSVKTRRRKLAICWVACSLPSINRKAHLLYECRHARHYQRMRSHC